jgi:hypothetical protein
MRKSLLAMAALMGVATLPAHAWRVNIDQETYADIGFATIVRGTYEGQRIDASNQKSALNFSVPLFNITAGGHVNKLVYFSMNLEGPHNTTVSTTQALCPGSNCHQHTVSINEFYPRVRDSFIGLKFADEFRLQAGLMRAPFSRAALTGTYVQLVPYTPKYKDIGILTVDPTSVGTIVNPRDAGVVVWGNVADGMLKYYFGVTDGETMGSSTDDSLAYTIRLQFTPTMFGFKGETGYTLADTYLGRQNVLSVGVGYRVVRRDGARDTRMLTVDMLYEQKFGDIVPNLQVGYISQTDTKYTDGSTTHYDGGARQLYAQAQLLYDQMVGFGKPALAIRWEQNTNALPQLTSNINDPRVTRFSIWTHYYIKGQNAKLSLGLDSVSLNSEARSRDCDPTTSGDQHCRSFTDITLQFQTQF